MNLLYLRWVKGVDVRISPVFDIICNFHREQPEFSVGFELIFTLFNKGKVRLSPFEVSLLLLDGRHRLVLFCELLLDFCYFSVVVFCLSSDSIFLEGVDL